KRGGGRARERFRQLAGRRALASPRHLDNKDLRSLYLRRGEREARKSEKRAQLADEWRPAGRLRGARAFVSGRAAGRQDREPGGHREEPGHSVVLSFQDYERHGGGRA